MKFIHICILVFVSLATVHASLKVAHNQQDETDLSWLNPELLDQVRDGALMVVKHSSESEINEYKPMQSGRVLHLWKDGSGNWQYIIQQYTIDETPKPASESSVVSTGNQPLVSPPDSEPTLPDDPEAPEEPEVYEEPEITKKSEVTQQPIIYEELGIPEEPTVPEEPEVTQKPENSEKSELPEQPEVPKEPEVTQKPENSEKSELPKEPTVPEEPEVTQKPENSEKSELPEQPEVPKDPEVTQKPENSEKSELPKEPTVPEEPEVTQQPKESEVSELPEQPEVPKEPEVTQKTENSEKSELPEQPEVPKEPEVTQQPKESEVSELPEQPEIPAVTQKSEVTQNPEKSYEPTIPDDPEVPDEPTLSNEPEESQKSEVTQKPEESYEPTIPNDPEVPDEPTLSNEPEVTQKTEVTQTLEESDEPTPEVPEEPVTEKNKSESSVHVHEPTPISPVSEKTKSDSSSRHSQDDWHEATDVKISDHTVESSHKVESTAFKAANGSEYSSHQGDIISEYTKTDNITETSQTETEEPYTFIKDGKVVTVYQKTENKSDDHIRVKKVHRFWSEKKYVDSITKLLVPFAQSEGTALNKSEYALFNRMATTDRGRHWSEYQYWEAKDDQLVSALRVMTKIFKSPMNEADIQEIAQQITECKDGYVVSTLDTDSIDVNNLKGWTIHAEMFASTCSNESTKNQIFAWAGSKQGAYLPGGYSDSNKDTVAKLIKRWLFAHVGMLVSCVNSPVEEMAVWKQAAASETSVSHSSINGRPISGKS